MKYKYKTVDSLMDVQWRTNIYYVLINLILTGHQITLTAAQLFT